MQTKIAAAIAAGAAVFLCLLAVARAQNPDNVKQLKETRKCVACDLREAQLDGFNLELGDLRDSDLRLASLYTANLRGADLTGADLTGTNLSGANLEHTKGANLTGAVTNERTTCPNGSKGPCQ